MKTDKKNVDTFGDIIRQRVDMDTIISHNAQIMIAGRAKYILCSYVIENWHSEPLQKQQNYSKRIYQNVKCTTNIMMKKSGSPYFILLLALLYVVLLLNNTAS